MVKGQLFQFARGQSVGVKEDEWLALWLNEEAFNLLDIGVRLDKLVVPKWSNSSAQLRYQLAHDKIFNSWVCGPTIIQLMLCYENTPKNSGDFSCKEAENTKVSYRGWPG